LVALKVLSAAGSPKPKDEIAELSISLKLDALIASAHNAACDSIQTIIQWKGLMGHIYVLFLNAQYVFSWLCREA